MKKLALSFLDYLPPIIAFIAATVAVVGSPKWDSDAAGFLKITPFGWLVLIIGALALVASILVTSRNKGEQVKNKQLREQIAIIGKAQLLRAMNNTIYPIKNSEIWQKNCERPETPLDLLTPERRKVLAALNLNSASPYADGSFDEIKWYSIIESAASGGAQEITTTLQIYSSYFSPEVMDLATRFLYSDFLQFRLLHIHDIVQANTHRDPNRAVPFFWVDEDGNRNADYEEFWKLMSAAMSLCGAELTSDGRPLFRRC